MKPRNANIRKNKLVTSIENLNSKLKTNKIYSFFLALIIITCFLFYALQVHALPKDWEDLGKEILKLLLSIIFLGFFLQLFIDKQVKLELINKITEAIQLNENDLQNSFTNEQRQDFIKANINSLIGSKYGSCLFDSLLKNYINNNITYRENFEYNVEMREFEKYPYNTIEINNLLSDYYHCRQDIAYEKHFSGKIRDFEFKIVFTSNEDDLNFWLNDNNVFFREILNFSGSDDLALKKSEELKTIFFNDFSLSISFNGINKERLIFNNKNNADARINTSNNSTIISIPNKYLKDFILSNEQGLYFSCEVCFVIPYPKDYKRFHYVLPEPTTNSKFTFSYCNKILKPQHVSYLTNNKDGFHIPEPVNSKFIVTSTETAYPRSGVVFFWS